MSEPKVLIQIALMDDGNMKYQSTSDNIVTNLGLIELAKQLATKPPKENRIAIPSLGDVMGNGKN